MGKLQTFVLLLGSNHAGEVQAAAAKLLSALARSGRGDLHWLAARIEELIEGPVQQKPNGSQQPDQEQSWQQHGDAFEDHVEAAEWLLKHRSARLRSKERNFLESIQNWQGEPTARQAQWLNDLCRKHGYRP